MRFFQFFTFDIVKSKKAFRRDLFEPEKELPQLPESNNYDEQFLSFFENMTMTDFTLHFSCCFTRSLHSHFIPLLNNFTMQEKCC